MGRAAPLRATPSTASTTGAAGRGHRRRAAASASSAWRDGASPRRGVLTRRARRPGGRRRGLDPFRLRARSGRLVLRAGRAERARCAPATCCCCARAGSRPTARSGEASGRARRAASPGARRLDGARLAAFLWDLRIAAVAADNPASRPRTPRCRPRPRLHRALIARLGMPLGELWDLGASRADCAADGVYECC